MDPRPEPPETSRSRLDSAAEACLCAVLLLVPFEPRRPSLHVSGLELTLLEAAAAVAVAVLSAAAFVRGSRLGELLRRPPLLALAGFALVHLVSAALAVERAAGLRHALRMVAAATFAGAVASVPRPAQRRALLALAVAALGVAALAVLEGPGVERLDACLALFRVSRLVVGGTRRATAGSEHPNLAAACLTYGLIAGAGLWSPATRGLRLAFALATAVGMALTWSRGALAAAVVGLAQLARGQRRREALAALGALVAVWIGSVLAGPTSRLRLKGEGTEGWYAVRCEPEQSQLALRPGEARSTRVRITNTGSATWRAGSGFMPAYRAYDASGTVGEGYGAWIERDIAPGDDFIAELPVRAPEAQGRYLLAWDVVHVHAGWFSDRERSPRFITQLEVAREGVLATGPSPALPPVVPAWQPGRAELWTLALRIWADHPLLGAGPDGFRRLYGRYAGRGGADQRTYANNLYLETAATTGTLGLVALAATLIATGRAAWRAPPTALSATLLALLSAIAAHGLVDYVQAFTGHYLVLGLVVGGSASLDEAGRA